jgi:serine/threonine-protein kinase
VEGTPFGKYRLVELIGRGGMGEVWKAFDTATRRVVAVKVLPAQLAADPVFEERFRHEAFAAAGLSNPHVVPIHNFGEIEGRLYVDMRLIEGRDLEHILADGPMAPARAVKIIEQIASALNAAHKIGLVHRDVKPSNILVAEDDFAYLIDFGIARAAGETKLTATGNVVGTWPYMAPERFTTGQTDTRSDIYALACVLYECLTSVRPFPGDSVEQQIASHLTTPPPRPSNTRPGLTPELDAVIAAGMAKNPDERYGTTTEMARAAAAAIANSGRTSPAAELYSSWTAVGTAPSMPTQAFAEKSGPAADAPTQARPVAAPPQGAETAAPRPWQRRTALVVPIAIVAIVAAIATIVLVLSGDEDSNPETAAPSGAGLNGTFAASFGDPTQPNGRPFQDAMDGSERWVIESACDDGNRRCVASAAKIDGSISTATKLAFDKVNGRWESVNAQKGTCSQAGPTEIWESMSLQTQPDGSLVGEFVVRSTDPNGASNRPVTFTRTGDAGEGATVVDPASLPAREVSPAQALYGRYAEVDTYRDGNRSADASFDIQTYCLRAGDRCLSYWINPHDVKILTFAKNQFVLANGSSDSTCQNGGPAHREVTLQYPLPPPAQDPITLLTGNGHYTVTGACPFNSDFDSRVQRTGD